MDLNWSRLITVKAYYPYIESVELPEGPIYDGQEIDVKVKLYFPEGTPDDISLTPAEVQYNPPFNYDLPEEFLFTLRGELSFLPPELDSELRMGRDFDRWTMNSKNELTFHVVARDFYPWVYEDGKPIGSGKGVIALLAASSPEYAGFIEWVAIDRHYTALHEKDRAWWDAHAYADGKLKWFYYEYPVVPRKESGSAK